eukprot:m.14516 g.14516  ORF g.14516 m.14516 type:complete len:540 (-) comp7629_c0_seq3:285-1904(-)
MQTTEAGMPGLGVLSYFCRGSSESDEVDPDGTSITDFIHCEELIEGIFQHLDVLSLSRCARTCRTYAYSRWPKVDLSQSTQKISGKQLSYIMAKHPVVLILPGGFDIDEEASQQLQAFRGMKLVLTYSVQTRNAFQPFLSASFKRVTYLDLSGSLRVAGSVQHLAEQLHDLPCLQHLLLDENLLEAMDIDTLFKDCPDLNLLRLSLSENELGDAGMEPLARAMKKLPRLQHLNLDNVGITSRGAKVIVQSCPHLSILKLSDNEIDASITRSLAQRMTVALREIDLKSTDLDANDLMPVIRSLRQQDCKLQVLRLWDNRISDAGVATIAEALEKNQSLRILDLRFNGITSSGARHLGDALQKNSTLRELSLKFNRVRNLGCSFLATMLAKNTALKVLDLEDNEITDDGLIALAGSLETNACLRELNLRNNRVTDDSLVDLARGLRANKSLMALDISAKPHALGGITKAGLCNLERAVLNNTTLRRINIHNHEVSFDQRPDTRVRSRSEALPLPLSPVISTERPRTGSLVRRPRRGIFLLW